MKNREGEIFKINQNSFRALLIAIFTLHGCSSSEDSVRLATGPQGGSWYPLGGALKTIIEKNIANTKIQTLPGAGIANVKAVESGKVELALANSVSTADAINGNPPFKTKAVNVCNIASLYPQYFQIVTLEKANIKKFNQLRGKILAGQGPGNTAEVITRHLLKVHGLTYSDLKRVNYGSYTDSVALMKDANADVFTLGTTIPAGAIMDLASVRDVRLLGINSTTLKKMQSLNPGYLRNTIPSGTYPKQDETIETIGYTTHLIGHCSLENEFIYNLLDTVFENISDLAAITKVMIGITPDDMGKEIGVPLHAGAANWYQEKSL